MSHKTHIPDATCNNVRQIPLVWLKNNNITAVLTDYDNTLAPWRGSVLDGAKAWIDELLSGGIAVALISNGGRRVKIAADALSVDCICNANKPFADKTLQFIHQKQLDASNICVVGDQLFTDIVLAKAIGAKSILVKRYSCVENPVTKVNRARERFKWKSIFGCNKNNYDFSIFTEVKK